MTPKINVLEFEPDLTLKDRPAIDLRIKKEYLIHALRWVHDGSKDCHDWQWFAMGWKCETAEEALAYFKCVYPRDCVEGRYEIVEICTTERVVPLNEVQS